MSPDTLPARTKPFNVLTTRWIIAAVLIIALIAGTGGYLLGSRAAKPTELSKVPAIHRSSPTPTITSKWKTYTDRQLGFSVQYPQDYSINIRDDLNFGAGPSIELGSASNFGIIIAIVVNTKGLSLDNPRQLFGTGPLEQYILPPETEVRQVSLGAFKAYRVDHCCGGYDGVEAEIKTVRDDKLYDIVVIPDSEANIDTEYYRALKDPTKKSIVEHIITTFTFLR